MFAREEQKDDFDNSYARAKIVEHFEAQVAKHCKKYDCPRAVAIAVVIAYASLAEKEIIHQWLKSNQSPKD